MWHTKTAVNVPFVLLLALLWFSLVSLQAFVYAIFATVATGAQMARAHSPMETMEIETQRKTSEQITDEMH